MMIMPNGEQIMVQQIGRGGRPWMRAQFRATNTGLVVLPPPPVVHTLTRKHTLKGKVITLTITHTQGWGKGRKN